MLRVCAKSGALPGPSVSLISLAPANQKGSENRDPTTEPADRTPIVHAAIAPVAAIQWLSVRLAAAASASAPARTVPSKGEACLAEVV